MMQNTIEELRAELVQMEKDEQRLWDAMQAECHRLKTVTAERDRLTAEWHHAQTVRKGLEALLKDVK